MIRKKNKFVKPRKMFEKERIQEENKLVEKYGLKNKKEVWKALARINYFRSRAKSLVNAHEDEKEVFFNKLKKIGLNVNSIGDVLALEKEDVLKRRLPTVVASKKLSTTVRQARQMVVHKKILVDGNIVNIPSYIVTVDEEKKIALRKKEKKAKVEEAPKEVSEDKPAEPEPTEKVEEASSPKEEKPEEESK